MLLKELLPKGSNVPNRSGKTRQTSIIDIDEGNPTLLAKLAKAALNSKFILAFVARLKQCLNRIVPGPLVFGLPDENGSVLDKVCCKKQHNKPTAFALDHVHLGNERNTCLTEPMKATRQQHVEEPGTF